ncbi:MAG: D-isomer specific 2-hydroxyacid dehydrogenase family protein [Actinomycetota bacterium]
MADFEELPPGLDPRPRDGSGPEPTIVSVTPVRYPQIAERVLQAGAFLGPPAEADALVWTDPDDPEGFGEVLAGSPARWVQLPFAGVDAFASRGLLDEGHIWTSAKGIYGPAVAEHALAMMLTIARALPPYIRLRGKAPRDELGPRRLLGQKVLIVGAGGIGRALIRLLEPHEPEILAVNRSGNTVPGATSTVPMAALPELVGQVDWVVLTLPLTPETRQLFGAAMFQAMSRQAWLVNVARGPVVDTAALVSALERREIAGALLDVTDPEPLPEDHPLWSFDNVIVTPHVANTWDMALRDLAARVERNVIAFMNGQPLEGVVDPALGY